MEQLSAGGWDALQNFGGNAKTEAYRLREEAEREARIVIECFGTPAGHACLEWLIKKTILRGPNPEQIGATTAEHYAIASAKREGQNATVFTILHALNFKDAKP